MFIRTAERIMIKCGSFKAVTFDELFEGTKSIPWERYLTRDAKFWVSKATSNKSALFSPSDIQSIVKKAMVERLKQTYHVSWFTEDGAEYPVRVFIFKDIVTIGLDTSGISLHKRGYRKLVGKAPISETLASALIMLTPWNKDRILVDPYLTQVDVGGLLIHMQRIIQRYYMLPKFLPMPFPKVIKYGCKLISAHMGILVPDLVDYLLRTRCAPFEQVYRVFAAFLMP